MTPYQILGIPLDADQDKIHGAYRTLAKNVHPDLTNGDTAAFERLKFAHDLLMDEDRRAHYDRTGEVLPATPGNHLAFILTMVSAAFDEAMISVIRENEDPQKVDLLQRMREALTRRLVTLDNNSQEASRIAPMLEPLIGRFSSTGTDNHLETIVREKMRQVGEIMKNIAAEREKVNNVLKFLADYRYRYDPATLVYQEPDQSWRPKVATDVQKPHDPYESRDFQAELVQRLYGSPPRS